MGTLVERVREEIAQGHRGSGWVAQEIRAAIEKGIIGGESDDFEDRIQPASYEPQLGNDVFVIDTEHVQLKPSRSRTIYEQILRLPKRFRERQTLDDGFEFRVGRTYAVPLLQTVRPPEIGRIKSEQKSTYGRTFLRSQLMADFQNGFDEVRRTAGDRDYKTWLLIGPKMWDIIGYAGMSINQLRFLPGLDAKLTDRELQELWQRSPLLKRMQSLDTLVDVQPHIHDGLRLHADGRGELTEGIVALRCRPSSTPIDTRKKHHHDPFKFVDPERARKGGILIRPREKYLFGSLEFMTTPIEVAAQLDRLNETTMYAITHEAGFIDPPFQGQLVFEYESFEQGDQVIKHGDPIGTVQYFWTGQDTDKPYGKQNNYQGQHGPRVAKFMQPVDYKTAAKRYDKHKQHTLVQDAQLLNSFRVRPEGYEPLAAEQIEALLNCVHDGFYHERYDCESDELALQVIPYIILFDTEGRVFSYQRSDKKEHFGEERLYNKLSVGVGGHMYKKYGESIEACIADKLDKEVIIEGETSPPKLMGTIMSYDTAVDRVHYALVYAAHVEGAVHAKPGENAALKSGQMTPIAQLRREHDNPAYETWTKALIPDLQTIYELSKRSA